ncbi:streptogrisin C [Allocatelliglobosispora scoriae]|uniref:Streptogrisin C n=1 Tax=Allocatelliglobosispora scoriae TaxID=643052 RepID=A0A841BN00_9ACTN|nr:S1 family peptidase [Allocatelliglobosispora scoriae]MBB5868343.1 streptogrisin C [Allocatelliglobosispora scoriae]
MNRRIFYISAVATLTMGITAALTYPAVAGQRAESVNDAATAAGVSPQVFEALARDLKLDTAGVSVRLANEAKANKSDLKLRKSLGKSYAGAWLSADAKTFTIAVTGEAQAEQVRAAGATPRLVKHSLQQLDAVKAKLDANSAKAPKAVPGWYVDVTTNTVVVLARAGADTAGFLKQIGADISAIRIEVSTENPVPLIDVIGGNAYYIGGSRCSVGFPVTIGFVSAGHCGTTGSTTTQPSGTFGGSSFPGNDYSYVRTASGNTPRPLVNRYSGSTTVSVAGSTDAAIGASVCRSGSTTGWHCGTIGARNASVTYSQGTVSGLIRTNVCAEPGDSGGSLIAGNQAQGVTSGGSGNCTSGGTTYFQPVNEILQAYGLTLMTSGTTPPSSPPPTSGCTGYEFTRSGTLSSGGVAYQPDNSYYTSTVSGTHRGCLRGPSGTDYDLYLQKWSGSAWVDVAEGATSSNAETLTYSGTAGNYRFQVHAYSGSGAYTMGFSNP